MKKVFGACFAGAALILTITSISYAQSSNSIAKLNPQPSLEKIIPISKQLNAARYSGPIFRSEISSKPVRNFVRNYKNVAEAEWFKSTNGLFVVYFSSDSINSSIYYNKKGGVEFMFRYYNEEKLPREVRHLVKSTYYDFSIFHVTEITWNNKLAYVVSMEDKRSKDIISYKIIKVVGAEMEVVNEFSKKMNHED
jgi:hypothetical protein